MDEFQVSKDPGDARDEDGLDDARYFRERLGAYKPPQCPEELVHQILARADEEAEAIAPGEDSLHGRFLPWWTRVLVPAAALVLMLLLLSPSGWRSGQPLPPAPADLTSSRSGSSAEPCALELEEIFRRLGVDRAEVVYDDATICAAAEDMRIALALMVQAMESTERVIGRETRGRISETLRKGLGSELGSPTKRGPGLQHGG